MGFPKRTFDNAPVYGYDGKQQALFSAAYTCPRCYTRTSEIPSQCNVCQIQLYSSSHIAKSYHHLFPVQNFIELSVTLENIDGKDKLLAIYNDKGEEKKSYYIKYCNGCLDKFPNDTEIAFRCQNCQKTYCVSCDLFIHEHLHQCPNC
jgi:transcription initiation factor TFIIH subunit 2